MMCAETVTGVVDGLTSEPTSALTVSVGLAAVGFGVWRTYFESPDTATPDRRAAGLLWMLGTQA